MTVDYSVVIPTVGRRSLTDLIAALGNQDGPAPKAVVLVDDRPSAGTLPTFATRLPVTVLRSGGRGPAAARNIGWRHTRTRWVCFLDDDVIPQPGWLRAVQADLHAAEAAGATGSQAVLDVPVTWPAGDDQRRTLRLADAQWITADMAYLRGKLVLAGGFDTRFPRAYREDSDLALRMVRSGAVIVRGARRSTHPVAAAGAFSSVKAQRGNQDNALMRRKHGRGWRGAVGEGPGRMPAHLLTTAAGGAALVSALRGRRRAAPAALTAWAGLTAEFTVRRVLPGPRTAREITTLAMSSALIPPVAVAHRLAGEWRYRRARRNPPLAVLFDRDDTLIDDGPYLSEPGGVRPKKGAVQGLSKLRDRGLLLGVVTNQSGVAKGLISAGELEAVNARVDALLGPFDCWQICVHDEGDGCRCRKPQPGMLLGAAAALEVDPARCVMIGDTGADVDAALAAHAAAVLVPTARTLPGEVEAARRRAVVAHDLESAIDIVLREF